MGDEVDQEWQTVKGRNRIDNKGMKQKIDIATTKGFKGDGSVSLTTFFFTDFPTSFGAKAMINAFHYYGDILEVVIPAKRDRRGRRFGFARFKNVMDAQGFESELANLTIGRDKISVNLSRYHRHEGSRVDRKESQKKRDDQHREGGRKGEGHRPFHKTVQPLNLKEPKSSYAQVVRKTKCEKQGEEFHRICLSYEADKEDLKRYQKAFIGKVAQSGMTYNIQEAFHREGYFGVKVTPLGSNLTLLEGQDEGEVEALMEDAKDWLDQWFSSIRPWSPNDIDTERSIWLRIYGIPIHAWNLNFFTQVVKPWGIFINADEGTTKKITMDVARIMIEEATESRYPMKIMSLNLRGWGNSAKRRRLSLLIKKGEFDICLFQETKRASFSDSMLHSLWGHNDIMWVAKESIGLSGGMLSVWNKDIFSFKYSFTGVGFLGICVDWRGGLLYIVNIYSPCSSRGKRKLWSDLIDLKLNFDPGEWCFGGDFNAIMKLGERRGINGSGIQLDRAEFSHFCDAMELVDIPVMGKKFT
jgi:hypothetical protein